jgi:hypothetical protein
MNNQILSHLAIRICLSSAKKIMKLFASAKLFLNKYKILKKILLKGYNTTINNNNNKKRIITGKYLIKGQLQTFLNFNYNREVHFKFLKLKEK